MRPLVVLVLSLAAGSLPAATVYNCVIDGVKTYQDEPCPATVPEDTPRSAAIEALLHKARTLGMRREELVRELRNRALNKETDLQQLRERRLLNDEDPPAADAEQKLLNEYRRQTQEVRRTIEEIDLRVMRIRAQLRSKGVTPPR